MERALSLAYLSTAPMMPPEALRLAEKVGYASIGVRVAAVSQGGSYSPLGEDPHLLAETRAYLSNSPVTVHDVEVARVGAKFKIEQYAQSFDLAGQLGAKIVTIVSDDPDESRFTDSFARCCDAAAPFGLSAALEFMPYSTIRNARDALRVVRSAGRSNGQILVDALHVARSDTPLYDLSVIPSELISHFQICDAPAEIPTTTDGLIHTARSARLLPGRGAIDLAGMLQNLPTSVPISVEIPNVEEIGRLGVESWAVQGFAATQKYLAHCDEYRENHEN